MCAVPILLMAWHAKRLSDLPKFTHDPREIALEGILPPGFNRAQFYLQSSSLTQLILSHHIFWGEEGGS